MNKSLEFFLLGLATAVPFGAAGSTGCGPNVFVDPPAGCGQNGCGAAPRLRRHRLAQLLEPLLFREPLHAVVTGCTTSCTTTGCNSTTVTTGCVVDGVHRLLDGLHGLLHGLLRLQLRLQHERELLVVVVLHDDQLRRRHVRPPSPASGSTSPRDLER